MNSKYSTFLTILLVLIIIVVVDSCKTLSIILFFREKENEKHVILERKIWGNLCIKIFLSSLS